MITELDAPWTAAVVNWTEINPAVTMLIVFALAYANSIFLSATFISSTVIFTGLRAIYATAVNTLLLLRIAGAICGDAFLFSMGRILQNDLQDYWPF